MRRDRMIAAVLQAAGGNGCGVNVGSGFARLLEYGSGRPARWASADGQIEIGRAHV